MIGRLRNGKWNGERGSVFIMASLGMTAILLVFGLCIDISHLYLASAELQNAADASALAGASALDSTSGGITTAVDRAVAAMNKYEFNKIGVTIARADVRFARNLTDFDTGADMSEASADDAANAPNIRFVQVTIPPRAINVFFASIALGAGSVDLRKKAVAGQSVSINTFCGVIPMSVVWDDVSGGPLDVNPGCSSQTEFTQGCTYTIRRGPGNGISPGNYQLLAIGGTGGSSVRDDLARATGACYTIGGEVLTKPGVTAGPVRQGMNTRFDDYNGGLSAADYPPDTNIKTNITYAQYRSGLPQYSQAPSHPGVPNRRVILVPIVAASEYDNGRDTVRISSVAAFFMQTKVGNGNGGEITAEYIGRIAIGDGGFNPGGGPGVPQLTVAVLYR